MCMHSLSHLLLVLCFNWNCMQCVRSCRRLMLGIIAATGSSIKWHFQNTWISHREHGWSLNYSMYVCETRANNPHYAFARGESKRKRDLLCPFGTKNVVNIDVEFNKIGHAIVSFAHYIHSPSCKKLKTRSWSIISELILDSFKVH